MKKILFIFLLLVVFFGPAVVQMAKAEWEWSGQAPYKNAILLDLQKSAKDFGIDDWKHRVMLGWFLTENGALAFDRRGDGGHALGLCQCNSRFRACAGADYTAQKNQCLGWFADYTASSTPETIFADILRGHNSSGGKAYTWSIATNGVALSEI